MPVTGQKPLWPSILARADALRRLRASMIQWIEMAELALHRLLADRALEVKSCAAKPAGSSLQGAQYRWPLPSAGDVRKFRPIDVRGYAGTYREVANQHSRCHGHPFDHHPNMRGCSPGSARDLRGNAVDRDTAAPVGKKLKPDMVPSAGVHRRSARSQRACQSRRCVALAERIGKSAERGGVDVLGQVSCSVVPRPRLC